MVIPDAILVTDTSVLVNFLRIDRMELLGAFRRIDPRIARLAINAASSLASPQAQK